MRKTDTVLFLLCVTPCTAAVTLAARAADEASFTPNSPAIVSGPQDIRAGKLVQSPGGKIEGTVKDVLPDPGPGGSAVGYVLVSTDSGTVGIPGWAITHLLWDAHIVIDAKLLAAAPRVREGQLPNKDWQVRADDYWSGWR